MKALYDWADASYDSSTIKPKLINIRLNFFSEFSDLEKQNTMETLGIIISFGMTSENNWNYCHYLPLDI